MKKNSLLILFISLVVAFIGVIFFVKQKYKVDDLSANISRDTQSVIFDNTYVLATEGDVEFLNSKLDLKESSATLKFKGDGTITIRYILNNKSDIEVITPVIKSNVEYLSINKDYSIEGNSKAVVDITFAGKSATIDYTVFIKGD